MNEHLVSPEVKPSVEKAIKAIKEHLDNEGDDPEVQILTIESKGLLEQMNVWDKNSSLPIDNAYIKNNSNSENL